MEQRQLELEFVVRNGERLRRTLGEDLPPGALEAASRDQVRDARTLWGSGGPPAESGSLMFGPAESAEVIQWTCLQFAEVPAILVFDDAVEGGLGNGSGFVSVAAVHAPVVLRRLLQRSGYASACTVGPNARWVTVDESNEAEGVGGPRRFEAELRLP